MDFGDPVRFRDANELLEQGLLNNQGKISGRAQAAVRPLSPSDFSRIVEIGLGCDEGILPRVDLHDQASGFSEPQANF